MSVKKSNNRVNCKLHNTDYVTRYIIQTPEYEDICYSIDRKIISVFRQLKFKF